MGTLGYRHSKLTKNKISKSNTVYGMRCTRFYITWESMKQRCLNKNHKNYLRYGGRGIKVCERWLKFSNFRDDMYESYLDHVKEFGRKNTSIDRIDNNGNYETENCRWSTWSEQTKNRRTNIKYKGECAIDASKRLGGEISLVNKRIRLGWSKKKAFTEKIKNLTI